MIQLLTCRRFNRVHRPGQILLMPETVAVRRKSDGGVKRWTATRKTVQVIEVNPSRTTVVKASPSFDLTPVAIVGWVKDAERRVLNALRTSPLDNREHNDKQTRDLHEAFPRAVRELRAE